MATLMAQADEVKGALKDGKASESTVTALQILLDLGPSQPAQSKRPPASNNSRSTQINSGRNGKTTSRRGNNVQIPTVHQDPANLSAREKYALATETANACLKILTESLKPPERVPTKALSPRSDDVKSTPKVPRGGSPVSQRALQPCSGNATPLVSSPDKQKPVGSIPSYSSDTSATRTLPSIVTTAECARLAFSFLRSVDLQKVGVREMPPLQLENGMLALIGKMIAHGLEHMAIKELRIVKRRLETSFPMQKSAKTTKAPSTVNQASSEKDTLATLMHLHASLGSNAEALAVAIAYYLHVLKIISASRNPAVIEEVTRYLQVETPNSVVDLILRHTKQDGVKGKGVKQLEALSQTILDLCPSVTHSTDEMAKDLKQSASPETSLELQTLALRIRKLWWSLAKHKADISKDLVEPFWKCATAFLRRHSNVEDGTGAYECLVRCFESLGSFDPATAGLSLFNGHYLLCSQAENAGMHGQAQTWAEKMMRDCASLEENHVRRLVCTVQKTTLLMKHNPSSKEQVDMDAILDLLQSKLTGSSADRDLLMTALAGLTRALRSSEANIDSTSAIRLSGLAAAFALRYSRSYPRKNTKHVQSVLDTALRLSKSLDDLLLWVTEDAAKAFIKLGALQDVAHAATTKPVSIAWTTSSAAMALSRLLRALLMRAVRNAETTSALIFDDQHLEPRERGVLLELQLKYAVELAHKTKYHDALRKILPDIFGGLSKTYVATEFPIRRARVAVFALRLRECNPELLPPHKFKTWHDTSLGDQRILGKDTGLHAFLDAVKAGLDLAKAFSDGQPPVSDLKPSLRAWERIIDRSEDRSRLDENIDDVPALVRQLGSIVSYFSMLGEDAACLAIQRLLVKLIQSFDDLDSAICPALIDLARQYLRLGYSEKAGAVFTQANSILRRYETPSLVMLQYQVAYAEYLLSIDNVDKCCLALDEARKLRSDVSPMEVSKDERRSYELLHAHGWFVQSKYLLEIGSPHKALAAAKRSVRVLNSIWSSIERSDYTRKLEIAPDCGESTWSERSDRTGGVSKLQLTPTESSQPGKAGEQNKKGAPFWPVVPLLCKALLHLSDMYTHHGLFSESSYYSERAIHLAESVGSSALLSRLRSHRSRLLTLAERTEEAELCLAHDDTTSTEEASQALVERYCSQAAIREKEGSLDEAAVLYEKAENMVKKVATEDFLAKLERLNEDGGDLETRMASMSLSDRTTLKNGSTDGAVRAEAKTRKAPGKKTGSQRAAGKSAGGSKPGANIKMGAEGASGSCYLVQKMQANIVLRKALVRVRGGQDIQLSLDEIEHLRTSATGLLQRRLAHFQELMRRAVAALEMDVTLNVLAESTLSLPAMMDEESDQFQHGTTPSNCSTTGKSSVAMVKSTRTTQKKATVEDHFIDLLYAARKCLLQGHHSSIQLCGTAQTHMECTMLLNATLLLSAISNSRALKALHPLNDALAIDLPRVKAMEYEHRALAVDEAQADTSELLIWPTRSDNVCSPQSLTTAEFQEKFVDILPKTWTAVSLCLKEDASELYIARYQSGQTPLILRLPFSRNKPEGLDEEAFDYHKGKAELREIIELSNHTCHNPGSLEVKGAKTKWWSERETLDRRMHELLINMENIWIGGFRGVFSQHLRHSDLLANFRKSFEGTLDRYLPSRKAAKGRTQKLSLHNQVLELFIGLGHDQDGSIDLDEPLADLLYFVVDMLQFNGERNAYDEIDFDSMAVEVFDALRSYHNGYANASNEDQHLILVLDRRLQSFPWESLPCLEEANVSRVGSMLSLRERILAQRASQGGASFHGGEGCHIVARTSGTYILNPSSDLPGTQTTLEPVLSKLTNNQAASWNAIINEEPDEARFTSALKASSMLLYFGHGAGSQYIRPRAIKRLDRCCDVVWLMGCSSGAVSEYGKLEPFAVPLAYLTAGQEYDTESVQGGSNCKAVVATLWDVTDKDIDRFSLALGEEWGLWPPSEQSKLPTKTPKKRQVIAAPSTPQQFLKTPKTPKLFKSPAPLKTPIRHRKRPHSQEGWKGSLVEAVSRSRDACYLRYLNGAAPVVYGVPVYLGD